MTRTASAPKPTYGERLTAFLQSEWDALGVSRGTWCRQAGLPDSTVHRWSQGIEPSMANLRAVADALHRPLAQILLAAGYLQKEDLQGQLVPPREIPSFLDALRPAEQGGDPTLSDAKREAMLQVSEAFDLVESGQRGSVKRTVKPRAARADGHRARR